MPVRIGELLLKEKRISAEQLQEALTYQRTNGGKLGANLVKLGFVKDEEITALLSKRYGVPSIALDQFEIDPAVIKLVSGGNGAQVPDRAAQPRRRDADDRDDGSDQRLRDGRRQVHDRLQRRAGRGVGNRGPRCDRQVLRRRHARLGEAEGRRPQSCSGQPAKAPSTRRPGRSASMPTTLDADGDVEVIEDSKRSAPKCSPARVKRRRSSSW